jgi:DNA primase
MPGLIDQSVLDQILGRINIAEVIAEYIPLKRAGRNFKACCPFHHEKTPSFMVSTDKQIYHCFGCGAGGNAFNFLVQYERLEFPEAVEKLAKRSGVLLPEKSRRSGAASGMTTQINDCLELACGFYQARLLETGGRKAQQYCTKRGIKPETAKAFRMGYAPDAWEGLIDYLRSKGVSLAVMEKAGLVLSRESGGYYDRFRDRLLFTISNVKSEVIGFGGRVFDSGTPKYINSPETPVYVKGRNLFNLNLAKEALRETDCLVLVEGYLDCLIPYQEGLRNICATCGTALTQDQAKLIKRFTENVVVVYDGDSAGQTGTLRSLDIFLEEEMNVRVAALPAGDDPDTFVRKNGIGALDSAVKSADNLFDYKLRILKEAHDASEPMGKKKISAEMLPTLKKIKNEVLRQEYLRRLAEEIRTGEKALQTELQKIRDENIYDYRGIEAKTAPSHVHPAEKLLIKLMLEEKQLIERVRGDLGPADFLDERTSRIVAMMFDLSTQGKDPKANLLVDCDPDLSQIIRESALDESLNVSDENKEKTLDECIGRLKQNSFMKRCRLMQEEIQAAEREKDEVTLSRLKIEFNRLIKTR